MRLIMDGEEGKGDERIINVVCVRPRCPCHPHYLGRPSHIGNPLSAYICPKAPQSRHEQLLQKPYKSASCPVIVITTFCAKYNIKQVGLTSITVFILHNQMQKNIPNCEVSFAFGELHQAYAWWSSPLANETSQFGTFYFFASGCVIWM